MGKIYFKKHGDSRDNFAVLFRKDGNREQIALNKDTLEFDNSKFDHLCFEFGGERTGKVYPGALTLGVEYKMNEKIGKHLTYLFSKGIEKTGRVENFVLQDSQNLSYREDKSKKISVFLPNSYDGMMPHDILFFFDAQNLFGSAGEYTENGDPYGSWQLDVVLNEIYREYGTNIIGVGIDNADQYREQELFMNPEDFGALTPLATALPDEDYSHGYLDGLSDFIVNTLHPFIKAKYCITDGNIGIGGASMGGIAAFYCGLREMGFYKYVISYSPAFALYETEAFERWFERLNFMKNADKLPKVHIYCGEGDPLERLLVGASKDIRGKMMQYGYPSERIFETFDAEKPHNEESWRLILPQSFTYLLDLK